jgi:hypothetical protein
MAGSIDVPIVVTGLDAVKKAQDTSLRNRKEMARKAKMYDQIKNKELDYEKLSEMLAEKIKPKKEVVEKVEPVQKEVIEIRPNIRMPKGFIKF